ncbi:hypothetical protein EPUS_01348 [Endocarpon pusillum Z07020]|uniref:Uncharacterized protein n=1 Tax=Endocarpon pusillum (strain Z07020 / HMAS-L-300199) TaxID=1263415 RepID=U1GED5_ENDPU|nr:uncharacterized protein EPUS_01348 [Endocarpon pusillum Z07020]ERF75982.1 hypothetical protein EPUS_01348 [Endocarpon pusillum Z07020]
MGFNHADNKGPTRASPPETSGKGSEGFVQEPVAVIGLACRLPGRNTSPRTLWNFLERGNVASNSVPESRFNLKGHYDGSKKPGTMRPPGGMFLEDVDLETFDASFFEISRAEAVSMDPNQRQLLEVIYEGLENAGVSLESIDGAPVGCFIGSFAADYHDMQGRDPEDRPPSIEVGIGRAILSNRISHFLNIKGPSVTVDSACSGSLVGVDMACRYLQTGEISSAIVAASNLYLSPEHVMDTGPIGMAHSPSGRCHTFDAKADGYIKAEAVNAIILKRLDDAIQDRDPIRAVIRGSSTNSDGRTPGIASPNPAAQAAAVKSAYSNAGIESFEATSYLECHGTGTPAGDVLETQGVSAVFAGGRSASAPLIVGSIKSNLGHSEPAAGLSGVFKAILAIENGIIPGNPTFETPNPKINFEELRIRASRTAIPWPKSDFRRASVNSFGYGGTNSHVILDELKTLRPEQNANHVSSYLSQDDDIYDEEVSARPYTLVFSANDAASLQAYVATLDQHVSSLDVKVKPRDLAYTLSERRSHHFYRGYIVAHGNEIDSKTMVSGKKSGEKPRIGFVFTGQGAQWSQMGKAVVDTLPSAKPLLEKLDAALRQLPNPPSWSLLGELTESRPSEHLRLPEFSQPLVTALQLVLLDVLRRWGVDPQSVVGHSSGEIAAACAAGYLSEEDAIKAAFYRGQSAKNCRHEGEKTLGMLAVGLGPDSVKEYLVDVQEKVQIACYNSPKSVTLSGAADALEIVKGKLVKHGHFARMLLVDLAYHSNFMSEIGEDYETLLQQNFKPLDAKRGSVDMFSSVLGQKMSGLTDAKYWRSNMESPVRFEEACREMLSGRTGADYLIEIGPSGALAGPVSQIKNIMGADGLKVQYCATLSRGADSINSLFDMAGKLFISGASIALSEVNNDQDSSLSLPSVIVDLPNYVWNHNNKYWHESQASKDWRFRQFPEHDLLGSKILATPWHAPAFRKTLLLERLPWLKDHRMGTDIIFPASGYISMAMEALYQTSTAQGIHVDKPSAAFLQYRLRSVKFEKALVLEEGTESKVVLSLNPLAGTKNTWYEFQVSSSNDGISMTHCTGLIRTEDVNVKIAPREDLAQLKYPTPAHLWYKAQTEVGYGFGPGFQKQLFVETVAGQRESRSITSLTEPESAHSPQSLYPMHPACIDGCFQTVTPSLWAGERATINAVLVPATLDNLVVYPKVSGVEEGLSLARSQYTGRGRREEAKSFFSDCSVFDQASGKIMLKMNGLRYYKLDMGSDMHDRHTYNRTIWRPDITFLSQDQLYSLAHRDSSRGIQHLIDLIAHKKPALKVLEASCLAEDSTSLWFSSETSVIRSGVAQYSYVSSDAKALLSAKEDYDVMKRTSFHLTDILRPGSSLPEIDYDLAIVKVSDLNEETVTKVAASIRAGMSDDAFVVFLEQQTEAATPVSESDSDSSTVFVHGHELATKTTENTRMACEDHAIVSSIANCGYSNVLRAPQSWAPKAYMGKVVNQTIDTATAKRVSVMHLSDHSRLSDGLKTILEQSDWQLTEHFHPYSHVQAKSIVLVIDETISPVLNSISESRWDGLRRIISQRNRILWVTEGSQMEATKPDNALVHGLFRTIRAEDRAADLVTLDVEYSESPSTYLAIERVLRLFLKSPSKTQIESEFVERGSIIHVNRVVPDEPINTAKNNEKLGGPPVARSLQDIDGVAMLRAERLGTLDSLCYSEMSSEELPILENHIEVDIKAAGLNFKDVAVTMGIVPENEHLLGLEGSGVVRRVGKGAERFRVGDRVALLKNGTFANRIQCPVDRAHHIPADMSFKDAATIPLVYLTSMYSLFDVGGLSKGHSVLIHSAAGGVGLSCIQLAQWIGAEIYVTVGTEDKRQFLHENFKIPFERMFSSRTTEFAPKIMAATEGRGIDVIINSLTGELLDESWRICADGGNMVEIGKKDIVDRNFLSMEPFDRNCSFRAVDFSFSKQIKDSLIASLLERTFKLVSEGHLKAIHPVTTYSFSQVPAAFAFMRSGRHIGKIVITDEEDTKVPVQVRPPPRAVSFEDHASYVIVGGLKGLCGSLAIYLAKHGAKNIVAMSRSGCSDERSRNVIVNCNALGCEVQEAAADVSSLSDVKKAFQSAKYPIAGIIQGAMVLKDKPYEMMTVSDYHTTLSSKVAGTWNLHHASLDLKKPLRFFTLLSSVSGVIGQKGQANYSAANVFLDAFSSYRLAQGLPAHSVDLGVIEDVGYVAEQGGMQKHFDDRQWIGINEYVLHKILGLSVLQQTAPIKHASASQLITGILVPQPADSELAYDARFSALFHSNADGQELGSTASSAEKDVQALLLLRGSGAEPAAMLGAAAVAVGSKFERTLRLPEPMEPGKSLSTYGLDSLSAVELRNWIRMELGVEVTVLEITSANSLTALCEKIVAKMQA